MLIANVQQVSAHVSGVSLPGSGTATIDGVLSPGEWDTAGSINFQVKLPDSVGGGTTPATLFVMSDADNLYLAVTIQRPSLDSSSISIFFDNDHDGVSKEGDDGFGLNANQFGNRRFGDIFFTFLPPCPPPFFCGLGDTDFGGTNDGVGDASNDGTFSIFEQSHPLNTADDAHDFSLIMGDTVGFMVDIRLIVGPTFPDDFADTSFPPFAIRSTSTNFGDIIIAPATLKITKNAIGEDAIFNFTVSNSTFTIPLSINTTATSMTAPITLDPGFYNVTEIVPSGWNLTASDCEKNSISLGTTLNINITAGDSVECVFEDTLIPVNGTLKITKNAIGGNAIFNFTVTNGCDCSNILKVPSLDASPTPTISILQ